MGWAVGPQKICPSTNPLVPVHVTSLWKVVFANVITLGVLRWDHPRFFKWALLLKSYPMIRKEDDTENRRNTEKRIERPCKDGDRVKLGPLRNSWNLQKLRRKEGSSLETSEGLWLCCHLELGLLASRNVGWYISFGSSHHCVVSPRKLVE